MGNNGWRQEPEEDMQRWKQLFGV